MPSPSRCRAAGVTVSGQSAVGVGKNVFAHIFAGSGSFDEPTHDFAMADAQEVRVLHVLGLVSRSELAEEVEWRGERRSWEVQLAENEWVLVACNFNIHKLSRAGKLRKVLSDVASTVAGQQPSSSSTVAERVVIGVSLFFRSCISKLCILPVLQVKPSAGLQPPPATFCQPGNICSQPLRTVSFLSGVPGAEP